jgi:hypothetical protein
MQEIEAEAAPQMDLPKKGEKLRVNTFEDIVTCTYSSDIEHKTQNGCKSRRKKMRKK